MFFSYILIILFFPFSLLYTIKVSSMAISVVITCSTACAAVLVQHVGFANGFVVIQIVTEYERAVILRLGRLTSRKAKGPGINMA